MDIDFSKYNSILSEPMFKVRGRVVNAVGLTIETAGPQAKMGDLCYVYPSRISESDQPALAEIVGFKEGKNLLMPYDKIEGIGPGSSVENTGKPLSVMVGDALLGHTLDGLGRPNEPFDFQGVEYSVEAFAPDPMKRKIIADVLPLGVKAVDGLITIGKGQRIGIFAGSGVGKSTLMGMFARNTKADINVIALIGERGREVREFIERDLGPEGMKRSVVVIATSDKPALERKKAAQT
ncbi:MAG: flagellum-specific ATP synthase FliI, partial [Lachnospiraceae bacterium]|nr:flagellum-specific ATP synthase FliI [Lachnospiraceae bacterium]